ncbi:uncharacterized protein LOC126902538 [Daktulosphaira vitifoliae]|uniref:uncharacterized protein LOC126902538 n=1 Tax=Daktulosphaira vitifoliae TaxID=58002 RepID=UPI0021AA7CD3|nr:uncharacterized protein LOC126902538 [Daktulosphaira vitifoliae]
MFKSYAFILALAVSSSIAAQIQNDIYFNANMEAAKVAGPAVNAAFDATMDAVSQGTILHKKVVRPSGHVDKVLYVPPPPPQNQLTVILNKVGLLMPFLDSFISGFIQKLMLPKQLIVSGILYVAAKVKAIGLKTIVRNVIIAAVVAVMGAIATVAVAGLITLISTICTVLPYMNGNGKIELSESSIDSITSFVLEAISNYEKK